MSMHEWLKNIPMSSVLLTGDSTLSETFKSYKNRSRICSVVGTVRNAVQLVIVHLRVQACKSKPETMFKNCMEKMSNHN